MAFSIFSSALCCLLFGLVLLPGYAFQERQEMGVNRPGGDYTSRELEKPDPLLCQRACDQDPRCKAYTYVRPGVQGRRLAWCWLKSAVPAAVKDECCISGVKDASGVAPEPPRMPLLEGHPIDEVKLKYGQQSTGRGLWFNIETQADYSCKGNPGFVIRQSPLAGTPVKIGQSVTLWFDACVIVPDVVKRPLEEALRILDSGSLGFKTTTKPIADVRPNTVLAQSPQPGSQERPGTRVQLTVAGPPPVPLPSVSPAPTRSPRAIPTPSESPVSSPSIPTPSTPTPTVPVALRMPNLVGQFLAEAEQNPDLAAVRATFDTESAPGSGFRPGTVASQSPAPGTVLSPEVRVLLGVATSPPQPGLLMPNLVGRQLEQAKSDPEVQSLGLRIESQDDDSSSLEPGIITRQSIEAGASITAGETVMLSVAARPPTLGSSGVAPWIIALLAAAGLGYFILRLAKGRQLGSGTPSGSSFPEVRIRSTVRNPEQHIGIGDGLVGGPELRVRARQDRGTQKLQGMANLLGEEGRGEQ